VPNPGLGHRPLVTPKGMATSFIGHAKGDEHPPLSLAQGKNSASMSLITFDVLDFNLITPFRCINDATILFDSFTPI